MEDETDLADILIQFFHSGFPLSQRKIRKLAWQYASKNDIKGFSEGTQSAGCKWPKGFLCRYPTLYPKKSRKYRYVCEPYGNWKVL